MTDELLEKIQRVLNGRITNQMKVVYLLVELRKLMDRERYGDPVLRTFSNWVVHTSIENPRAGSTLILTEFDDFITDIYERKTALLHPKHLSLGTFRLALKACFERFRLNAPLVSDPIQWGNFGKHYCAVVGECPILFTASSKSLNYVKQVELSKINHGRKMGNWRTGPLVGWKVTLQDGHTMNWGFYMT